MINEYFLSDQIRRKWTKLFYAGCYPAQFEEESFYYL